MNYDPSFRISGPRTLDVLDWSPVLDVVLRLGFLVSARFDTDIPSGSPPSLPETISILSQYNKSLQPSTAYHCLSAAISRHVGSLFTVHREANVVDGIMPTRSINTLREFFAGSMSTNNIPISGIGPLTICGEGSTSCALYLEVLDSSPQITSTSAIDVPYLLYHPFQPS